MLDGTEKNQLDHKMESFATFSNEIVGSYLKETFP